MSGAERLGLLCTGVLPLIVLGALARRWRLGRSRLFNVYLASVAVFNLPVLAWPHVFFHWPMWLLAETVQGTLMLAVAVEIGRCSFATFPRALQTARLALVACLVAGAALMWASGTPAALSFQDLAQDVVPRLGVAGALAFVGLFAVTLLYECAR